MHSFGGEDFWVHAFLKGISPKGCIITRLEFELAYNDVSPAHCFYTTEIPPGNEWKLNI